MSLVRIFCILLLAITLLLAGVAYRVLTERDAPETFLDNNPEIRAHPDYPVRVRDVSALADQIIIDKDVWVEMRDGTRLSANIFRPNAPGQYPVVVALTAYDKNKGPDQYPKFLRNALNPDFNLGTFEVSPWTSWEAPDPAFWVPNGYAVVYLDSRGFATSEGKPSTLSRQDRDDFFDAIEWAGTRDWSNGHVGLNGVSYLAIAQWVAASGNPPHLKAIIPWEGQSDSYREVLYHGGIPETAFTDFWSRKMRAGANGNPLPPPVVFRFAHQRPALMRRVQQRPATTSGIDLPKIDAPALISATWSDQGLHTRGSFEGYKRISSSQKWLYTHGRAKWDVYYSADALAYQKDFFDHFLKGLNNGFDERPAVRLEVRENLSEYQVRYETDWPIPDTVYTKLYLDAASGALSALPSREPSIAQYDAMSENVTFTHTFTQDTELGGNMKLKLWVSISQGEDMDLFVGIEKLTATGEVVPFFAKTGYTKGPVAMGWLRVSQRALNEGKSTHWQPVLSHEVQQPLLPGEVVPVEIEILPSSTLFRAGETLRLIIQGDDLFEHPALKHGYSVNEGVHKIHAGSTYNSHLLVPVIPQ